VDRTHPNVTLAVLALGGVAYAMLSSMVVPALPSIQRDLHASETGITWLLTAYLLSASVSTSILGRLGDMYGKERLLLWTLGILIAGTVLAAVASSLGLLIAARFIQGAGGGIFPLAFGIVRDEFPRERVAGGIVAAALATWRWVPESPIRVPGRVNWLAAILMTVGISLILLAISKTTKWGWGSTKTLGLVSAGVAVSIAWIAVEVRSREPLIDMAMMRVRGVWTTNAAALLLGAGMYSSFIVLPQFAQLPKSTGFGFGASVVVSGLYLLPSTVFMTILGLKAGAISARFGSRAALLTGTAFAAAAFAQLALAHRHPYELLIAASLLGVGVGLAFAALGNLIVEAVPSHQTGVATGMNTVMRTLGGALGGELAATFIADNVSGGRPTVTGFTDTFVMATAFLVACLVAGAFVPRRSAGGPGRPEGVRRGAARSTEGARA
jgi:MFS family permease